MSQVVRREAALQVGVSIVARLLRQALIKELEAKERRRRRWWVRPWIKERETRGASATLLTEWASSTPDDLKNHLRVNRDQFSSLLDRVTPKIQKQDTFLRDALPSKLKLEMTLRYLATGDNLSTLSALYRVPKNTFSVFLPEVCDAIYEALSEYIQVSSHKVDNKQKKGVNLRGLLYSVNVPSRDRTRAVYSREFKHRGCPKGFRRRLFEIFVAGRQLWPESTLQRPELDGASQLSSSSVFLVGKLEPRVRARSRVARQDFRRKFGKLDRALLPEPGQRFSQAYR